MNERLKELYQQAHSIRRYDGDPALDGNPPTVYWQGEVSAQRFAELIVWECVKIIEDEAFNNYNKDKQRHPNSFEAGHDSGMFWSVGMIKKHFGVEE